MTNQVKILLAVFITFICAIAVVIGVYLSGRAGPLQVVATPQQSETQSGSAKTSGPASQPAPVSGIDLKPTTRPQQVRAGLQQLERVRFGETAFEMPASRPVWPNVPGGGESLASQMHAIIQQTPRGHADVLEALAAIVAANKDPRSVAYASARGDLGSMNTDGFPRLVDALLEGDADDQLLARAMAQVHVNNNIAIAADWKYGSVVMRLAVQKLLWVKAVTVKDSDPAAAARFARACVLFTAYDDFPSGRTTIRWAMNKTNPPFATVAQLSDAQVEMIQKITLADETMVRSVGIFQNTLNDSIDSWVDEKSPVLSAVQRERFLILIEKWGIIGDAPKVPITAWQVANAAWRVMNLAKSVGDQETIDAVTKLLGRMGAELVNPEEQRWFEEAITMTGPPPRRSQPFMLTPNAGR